jgi:hypothetical protein
MKNKLIKYKIVYICKKARKTSHSDEIGLNLITLSTHKRIRRTCKKYTRSGVLFLHRLRRTSRLSKNYIFPLWQIHSNFIRLYFSAVQKHHIYVTIIYFLSILTTKYRKSVVFLMKVFNMTFSKQFPSPHFLTLGIPKIGKV